MLPALGLVPAAAMSQTITKVTMAPASLVGGNQSIGTVTISKAASTNGYFVFLASSDPAVTVPAVAKVPAGATTITFRVNTTPVANKAVATITASQGTSKATATETVNPPSPATLTLSPATVTGGNNVTGIIVLDGKAPSGGLTVAIGSSLPTLVGSPGTALVPAGTNTVKFTLTTVPTSRDQIANITVSANTHSVAAPVKVLAPVPISVTLSPNSIVSGNTVTGTVKLSGKVPSGGMLVSLQSNQSFATVPTGVTVQQTQTSATFPVKATFVYPSGDATISATSGSTSATGSLHVIAGSPLANSPWPKFQADQQNTGRSTGLGPRGSVAWKFNLYGGNFDLPIVGPDGQIYVSNQDWLNCFKSDGTPQWTLALGSQTRPKFGPDGTLYVLSGALYQNSNATLNAVTPDGKVKWSLSGKFGGGIDQNVLTGHDLYSAGYDDTRVGTMGSFVIGDDGTIYVGGIAGISAVSPNGALKWMATLPHISFNQVRAGGAGVILATGTDKSNSNLASVWRINSDGTFAWKHDGLSAGNRI